MIKIVLIRFSGGKKSKRSTNFSMKFSECLTKKSDNTSAYFSMKMLGLVTLRYETNLDKVIHCRRYATHCNRQNKFWTFHWKSKLTHFLTSVFVATCVTFLCNFSRNICINFCSCFCSNLWSKSYSKFCYNCLLKKLINNWEFVVGSVIQATGMVEFYGSPFCWRLLVLFWQPQLS